MVDQNHGGRGHPGVRTPPNFHTISISTKIEPHLHQIYISYQFVYYFPIQIYQAFKLQQFGRIVIKNVDAMEVKSMAFANLR